MSARLSTFFPLACPHWHFPQQRKVVASPYAVGVIEPNRLRRVAGEGRDLRVSPDRFHDYLKIDGPLTWTLLFGSNGRIESGSELVVLQFGSCHTGLEETSMKKWMLST